jgi:hypothetical protein
VCAVAVSLGACSGLAPSGHRDAYSFPQEGSLFDYHSIGGLVSQETTIHVDLDGSASKRERVISDSITVTSATISAPAIDALRADLAAADLEKLAGVYLCVDRGFACDDTPLVTLQIPADDTVYEITFDDASVAELPPQLDVIAADVRAIVRQVR